jgi:hypothetical protein
MPPAAAVILKNCCPCPQIRKSGGSARGEQRAALGPNFKKNPAIWIVKKVEIQFLIEKIYRFWGFSFNIIFSRATYQ